MGLLKRSKRNFCRVLAIVLAMVFCVEPLTVSANNYRMVPSYQTFKDGKYIIGQSISGDIVYDTDGNVLISPGRYCRTAYLGKDLFAVYKIQDGNNSYYTTTNDKDMGMPYLLDLAKGTEKKMKLKFQNNNDGMGVNVHPYSGAYAKVENTAFYAWTTMTYYQFIDKKGKSLMMEQPYSYCSDMIKVDDNYYFYTLGDELSYSSGTDKDSLRRLSKRDVKGKSLKSIVLEKGFGYDIDIVKYKKKYYIRIYAQSTSKGNKWLLYDTNIKKVKKYTEDQIKDMEAYDPVGLIKFRNGDMAVYETLPKAMENDKYVLEREWVFITPYGNADISFDVAGQSKDESAWVIPYNTAAKTEKIGSSITYELDGPGTNQAFMFEKVGTDDDGNGLFRIWAAHSGRQLKSCNWPDGKIHLAQGSYNDTDSKGKQFAAQIFTVIENNDGSISILNNNGKYLTIENGELIFKDYAGGSASQKFTYNALSITLRRDGTSLSGGFDW